MKRVTGSRFFLIACVVLEATALSMGSPGTGIQATTEELSTARVLIEAHQVMADARVLPGGCRADGAGVVDLARTLQEAGLPAPTAGTKDAWGNPLMAWCRGEEWAVISAGSDGILAGTYAELPEVGDTGDDFVLIDDRRFHAPAHIMHLQQTGRQKRTMSDLRSLGIVFESYNIDNQIYPGASTEGLVPAETITDAVQPIYIRQLPLVDGWGNPIWIWTDGGRYRVVSAGADGILQQDWTSATGAGPTNSLDSDIVFGDGEFLQWPEGEQVTVRSM